MAQLLVLTVPSEIVHQLARRQLDEPLMGILPELLRAKLLPLAADLVLICQRCLDCHQEALLPALILEAIASSLKIPISLLDRVIAGLSAINDCESVFQIYDAVTVCSCPCTHFPHVCQANRDLVRAVLDDSPLL